MLSSASPGAIASSSRIYHAVEGMESQSAERLSYVGDVAPRLAFTSKRFDNGTMWLMATISVKESALPGNELSGIWTISE